MSVQARKAAFDARAASYSGASSLERFERGRRKVTRDIGDFLGRDFQRARRLDLFELAHHLPAHFFHAQRIHEDLDAGLVDVVAAAGLVVDAHHGFEEREDILLFHEVADDMADIGRAPHAAAGIDAIAGLAFVVPDDLDADVVEFDGGAVVLRARHGDLELARQEREFGMQRRPLPHDLGQDARIFDLVGGGAGEMVGGDVADAIAARLDRVHLDGREIGQRVGHVDQLDPVELDVLPRGEMAVAFVVFPRDVGQHAQLLRRQRAVRHGDAQHVGVELQVEPVHQAQRLELVFRQFAGKTPFDLIAELLDAVGHEARVELVIAIHRTPRWIACRGRGARWDLRRG